MTFKIITPPVSESIALQEAKDHLRVVGTDDDALINRLISAARGMLEQRTGRRMMLQTIEFATAGFGAGIFVPAAPLVAVTSVTYADSAGATQTLSPTGYFVDSYVEPAAIIAPAGGTWPVVQTGSFVTVRAQVGYANAASVPAELKQWMLLTIATLYDNRTSVVAGVSLTEMPEDFMRWLWQPYMVYL